MTRPLLALIFMLAIAVPALAQRMPPPDGLPLSQIIAAVEAREPVQVFTEVEWDDDGYWDIEYVNTDNGPASVRIDPMSGETWMRRN